jgi:hypothetical protein
MKFYDWIILGSIGAIADLAIGILIGKCIKWADEGNSDEGMT